MARPGISSEEVYRAADELEAEGVAVTVTAVRKRLGDTGSYTTVASALKEWRSRREEKQAVDSPAPPEVLNRLLERIWFEAWNMARESFAKEKAAFTQAQQQIEQERAEMSAEIGRLETELARIREDLNAEKTARGQCAGQLEQLKIDNARLAEREKALDSSNQSLQSRLEEERKRSERLEKTLIELAGKKGGGKE